MKYVEFTGKTVDEAVEKGLAELGLKAEDAEIRVLEEGKKKLFGSVKARVEIAAKACSCGCEENAAEAPPAAAEGSTDGERTVVFLEGLFKLLNITACTELIAEGEKIEINVTASNTTAVIGKHGGMLDAIQTLAGAVANTGRENYKRVVVDCEDYREKREATLNKLAENLAQKSIRLEKKIKLEPMNPYERRIIHAALSNREGVTTISEGKEPNRYIVIIPDNLADPDAPAIPARTERDGRRNGGRGDRRKGNRGGNRGGYGNRGGNRGGRKPMGRKPAAGPSGGTSLKGNTDFFGIFLGNSGNSEDKE